jgi:hypothetical protein
VKKAHILRCARIASLDVLKRVRLRSAIDFCAPRDFVTWTFLTGPKSVPEKQKPAKTLSPIAFVLSLGLLFTLSLPNERAHAGAGGYSRISFYVVAHQDDWELFRGEAAYRELISPTTKVVFIYTTAGDAGWTNGWWEAREQGAIAAVRSVIPRAPLTIDVAKFKSHPVVRYTSGNSVSYFLRLPDGNVKTGKGYPVTGNQSLAQLRSGAGTITAIDKSTTYESWADLWQTLQATVAYEKAQANAAVAVVNAPDYDIRCNPGDHTDHLTTGNAVRMFVAAEADRVWFVGYDTKNRPVNLGSPEVSSKFNIFLAYSRATWVASSLNGKPTEIRLRESRDWSLRSYYRFVKRNNPDLSNPPCAGAPPRAMN